MMMPTRILTRYQRAMPAIVARKQLALVTALEVALGRWKQSDITEYKQSLALTANGGTTPRARAQRVNAADLAGVLGGLGVDTSAMQTGGD